MSRFLVAIIFFLTIISINNVTVKCVPDTTVDDADCKIERWITDDPQIYVSLVGDLLSDLSINTCGRPQYVYRTGLTDDDETTEVYGRARCDTRLSGLDCMNCLGTAAEYLLDNCPFSVGAKVLMRDCFMRYENFPFYDEYY